MDSQTFKTQTLSFSLKLFLFVIVEQGFTGQVASSLFQRWLHVEVHLSHKPGAPDTRSTENDV